MVAQTDYAGFAVPTQLVGTLPSGAGPGTVVQLLNGTGYPTGALGVNFVLTFDKNTGTEEKILCSLRSGNNVTIAQRGYDDTSPAVHTNGSVAHTVDATILRTASAHIFDLTRDDHTQYARTNGARAITGLQVFNAGFSSLASAAVDLFAAGRNLNFRPALDNTGANMGIQSADWNGDGNFDGMRINGSDGVGIGTTAGVVFRLASDGKVFYSQDGAYLVSTVGGAGGASALPATPVGYMIVNINGTDRKMAYFNV